MALSDTSGVPIDRLITDAGGSWSFDALVPGRYRVTFSAPDGHLLQRGDGAPADAVTVDIDTSGSAAVSPASAGGASITMTSLGRIENRVWDDDEGDGLVTGADRGMPGVVVTLLDAARLDGAASPVAVTTTDDIGRYRFDDVPSGDYVVALGPVVAGVTSGPAHLSALAASSAAGGDPGTELTTSGPSFTVTPDIWAIVAPEGRSSTSRPCWIHPSGSRRQEPRWCRPSSSSRA